jgi:AcrR family transcriptional regulator
MPGPNPDTSTATQGGLRALKKARTRREIQRQTLRLIEEQGFTDTTVEQIAEAAVISPSTFFRYFHNKEAAAVADFLNEELFLAVMEAPEELDLIEALVYGVRHTVAELSDEDWRYARLRARLVQAVPELGRGVMEGMAEPLRFSVEIAAQRIGFEPDSLEARLYGGAVFGGLIGILVPVYGDVSGEPMPESRDLFADTVEMALRALGQILRFPRSRL